MRYWSLLILATTAICVGCFVYAAFDPDWWLPRNLSARGPLHIGADVDRLFFVILGLTGVVFVGTMLALAWTMWRYPEQAGRRAHYTHGSHKLELVWTLIPTVILFALAFYQLGSWADIKFRTRRPAVKPLAEVSGRQFNWMVRYPGPDGQFETSDDLHVLNDLHIVRNEPVLINLKSQDVIHSFFLPEMRIKQDALPGLSIPVWFDADDVGEYELVCAELCGWGHYKMRGLVTVHESRADFDAWMASAYREQERDRPANAPPVEPASAETTAAAGGEAAGENS